VATDYHINETPMLEQDDHFKHLYDNPTYIRPEDWREVDVLVDWLIEKNKSGYQMVNSVQRLQEIKAFMRMSSGLDLKEYGWNGDGTSGNGHQAELLASMPGLSRRRTASSVSRIGTAARPEQRNHSYRWHRGALLPDVRLDLRLGKHRSPKVRPITAYPDEIDLPAALFFDSEPQSRVLLQRRACDQVALVQRDQNKFQGGVRSFED